MPIESDAGDVLMVGLPGPDLDSDSREALEGIAPSGVVLFRRNLDEPLRLLELHGALSELRRRPRIFAIDQEGGPVSRLEPWIGPTPDARALADAGPVAARRFGDATAAALRSLGLNLDLAPVVDLSESLAGNAIGRRSFGTDAGRVVDIAGAFLAGLQDGGVAGCLKHFPGLGGTSIDSHCALPVCDRALETLEAQDLVPFRELCRTSATVMVGHAAYPGLDPISRRPASLSPPIVEDWLRSRLAFEGTVITDDLEMGAITESVPAGASAAVAAIEAGCDLLLYCADLRRATEARSALVSRAHDDPAFEGRLRVAAAGVRRLARHWPPPIPGRADFRAALDRLRRAAALA